MTESLQFNYSNSVSAKFYTFIIKGILRSAKHFLITFRINGESSTIMTIINTSNGSSICYSHATFCTLCAFCRNSFLSCREFSREYITGVTSKVIKKLTDKPPTKVFPMG